MKIIRKLTRHNKSSRKGHRPKMLVLHGDAGRTDAGTVSWIQDPESRVSYHWLIGRDGTAYQLVQEVDKAWHAGVSEWHGLTIGNSVNPTSIGVAFANDGKEPYKPVQYEIGGRLCSDICKRWGIPLHAIRGHHEVSPGRKTDPWDHFNWRRFYTWFAYYSADRDDMAVWDTEWA